MQNQDIINAYLDIVNATETVTCSKELLNSRTEIFYSLIVNNPIELLDTFNQAMDFKRKVQATNPENGQPLLNGKGNPLLVTIGTNEKAKTFKTFESMYRKVFEVDNELPPTHEDCRKRYSEIKKGEQTETQKIERIFKSIDKTLSDSGLITLQAAIENLILDREASKQTGTTSKHLVKKLAA